jgi:predicted dehydrogenase
MTPLRLGMVGGGPGSFIGPVHRMAAELDGRIRLVAGAFSRDAARSRAAAAGYGLAPERGYAGWRELLAAEAGRPDGIELLAVAAPNALHFPVCRAAAEAGIPVLCDKPATATLDEALALRRILRRTGTAYGLTYTYSGYPMVRAARDLVRAGRLGRLRKLVVDYSQGWLAEAVERTGNAQARWRTDPAQAGAGGCIGDIGTHAFHLAEFVTGERVAALCAQLTSVVPGRRLDDDCNILLRFAGGMPGVLIASQVAAGARNGLRLRVWGERGGLDWSHETPDRLLFEPLDGPAELRHAAGPRLPAGHPEGYIEAFATLYRDVADALAAGRPAPDVPGIEDGVRGMAFIAAAVAGNGAGWVPLAVPDEAEETP